MIASSTDAPMIRFTDVEKRYGTTVCLDKLDFSVAPGEFVTLIGPSGSGKTTILRLLMGLERIDAGTIEVGGEYLSHRQRGDKLVPADEAHLRRVRRKIGMVFQQFNLFPNMTVLRNITEGPIRGLGKSKDEAEQRARELLELVGLTDKINARPAHLSGGQQQRVAIARALAMDPEVLLLDEVTSALDPELVTGVLHLLADIAATTEITFLCVTHEMRFARKVSDRVMMFDAGRVLEDGDPDQIFTAPQQDRTRDFLRAVLDEH
ncbi:ectoine/hydroxyectoine ABC transporter ATP-binding protein EhuA [Nocardia sp. NBC_00565]|uniref:ectoine/hydroxyectoine ABC transporter ATP-binding protein EhuA n=1 Tax=Nocardia sp. NBC_00565 TaxID=2975993 RepID=UPI002E8122DF|nr:ectoine/hydroxyectoine ABC transporter ATP-binding protein EhuA [Nocardia sp. NBC_00565]WUB99916.1 ectoine/hydroxyectoine ABC transporter ATP-binding protein EhuA [Nocardia sp. NBC_00565]